MTTTPAPSDPEEQPNQQSGAAAPKQAAAQGSGLHSLKVRVGEAMERWGGGVSPNVRELVSGQARFDKFTERAKRVLVLAEQEARGMNHNYIGTEHLLLGLSAEGNGIAAKVLEGMDVSLDQVRRGVQFVIGRGDKPVPAGQSLSLTPRAKKVIALAADEARELNHNYIGTEHMLLGLVREGEGIAAGVLENMGAGLDQVRETVVRTVGGRATRDTVISCRVGAEDLAAIDLLVEAGIRTTRSDAAQWLIHAGITTNQALFEQIRGTVDEIRRLREQARQTAWKVAGDAQTGPDRAPASDTPAPSKPDQ